MRDIGIKIRRGMRLALFFAVLLASAYGCTLGEELDKIVAGEMQKEKPDYSAKAASDYYEKFYKEVTKRVGGMAPRSRIAALEALPRDPNGYVNWTAAVEDGYINPRPSIDPNVEDDQPLNLNVFIEAKTPLMANVIFPHSIHTYWLTCNTCHPKIFMPEAGANPITMDEIFKGEWCGRCHGKVAFQFWPRENCLRCHIIYKGGSKERESFR